jgi:fibronectin type 3 domain-containing protein
LHVRRPIFFLTAFLFGSFAARGNAQTVVRQINAGGGAVASFVADTGFSTGNEFSSTAAINLTGVTNPAPQAVYQSVRWATAFNYTLTGLTANTAYLVRLHFVELSFGASGQRTFNVAINGASVLTNFDIFASVGQNHALVREFTATSNASGAITIAFSHGTADNPSIAGIEIVTGGGTTQAPYLGSNWSIANGATIQAENYDTGGEGTAYHDTTSGNTGGGYRADDVDLEPTSDTGGGYNVGWTVDGEWLEYTTNTTAGTYNIVVRGASASTVVGAKSLRVLLDGTVLGTAAIPNTGGWQTWQDFTISGVPITGGTGRILRLEIVGGDFNINYVRFTSTTAQPPAAPTGLTAAPGNAQVALNWNASSGATSYNVYRGTSANGEGATAIQTGVTATSFTNTGLTNGTTYFYKVAAVNASGTSAQSNEVSVTPTSGAPAAPTGLTASPGNAQAVLNWNASSGATSYNVYRGTSANGEGATPIQTGVTATSFTNTGLTNGTTYFYKVAAVNASGTSAQSSEASVTPTGGANPSPNTPVLRINAGGGAISPFAADTGFSAGNQFSSGATISVAGVTNAAPAAVYQSVRWNPSFTYTLGGLTSGTSYVVRLHFVELSFTASGQRLFNVAINGTSVLSNFDIFATSGGQNRALEREFSGTANSAGQIVVSFTAGPVDNPSIAGLEVWTQPVIPAAPTALGSIPGNGSVSLIWNGSSGASSYNVYRGTASNAESGTPIATGITSVNYTDATVANGTTYFYKVAAVNSAGTSALSNETSALPHVVAPPTPASLTASNGFGNIPLSWSPSAGAATYNLYRSTTTNGEGNTPYVSGLTGTTYTDTSVTAGTTYFYKVAAVNSAGTSVQSTEASASPLSANGRGAVMPYIRYRAADTSIATLSGGATRKSSPNFDKMNLASQASDQAYVELPSSGASVQWRVTQNNAAGVTMRFTLPDTANGMGQSGSVDCYVNNVKVQTIVLTSYYMWQYFGGGGDPSDTPTNGVPAFAFDEVHWLLATPLQANDTIRIQSTGGPVVGVDFLEIETVPAAIAQPAGSISVAAYGASSGAADNLAAFNAAVAAAVASPGKTLYIPAGTYKLSSMWVIGSTTSPIANLTITGAGMWYTNIQFTNDQVAGGGCSIRLSATGTMDFSNMYLNSNLRSRYNENAIYKCFMDNFGVNSHFHDLWEDHFECGYWVADYAYNPCHVASGLVIENNRIRNNLADGVNFCNGTNNSIVRNCSIRNNGDDGLAVWPNNFNGAPMAVNDTFTHNTIEFIWRAAGIAFYGGSGHQATFNFIKDNFMSAGFHVNTTFPGYHFENNTGITVSDTTIVACGTSYDAWAGEQGAVDLEASATSVRNFTFTNIDVVDAQRDGYAFGFAGGFSGIQFTDCTANGTGLDGITTSKFSQQHLGAGVYTYSAGAATFTNFQYSNCAGGKVFNQGGFVLTFQ